MRLADADLLAAAEAEAAGLGPWQRANLREMRRRWRHAAAVPGDLVRDRAGARLLGITQRDALLYAAGCNAGHGLRRTGADKLKAVRLILADPEWAKCSSRWIAEGVVAGIAGYGNAVGVPTVGGETVFDDTYADNPLVNVLCVGVLPVDRLVLGRATGEGNFVSNYAVIWRPPHNKI